MRQGAEMNLEGMATRRKGRAMSASTTEGQTEAGKPNRRRLTYVAVLLVLAMALVLALSSVASAAVTSLYSNSATVAGASGATSVAVTYTAANTGANRLMLVGVVWNCGTSTDNETINTATYTPSGGSATAMTLLYDYDMFPGSGTVTHRHNAVYYVVNPTSGAGQVDITFNSSGGDGVDSGIVAGVSFFGGVNQSTPLGTYATASGGATSSSTVATVDVIGLNGNELVFDSLFRGGANAQTPGAGQTALWNTGVTNARGAASYEQATSGTVTMSWATTNGQWIIIAVPIIPTAAGASPVVTDIPNQTIAEGSSFATINLDGYVSDADNTDGEMTWTYSGNTDLTVNISGSRVATISTPNANWFGAETITFKASDPNGNFDDDAATFTVTNVNDPPVAVDDTAHTAVATLVNVNVLGNDTDVDGDTLTVSGASTPSHGTATVKPDYTIDYTPTGGYVGGDTFTYTVSDGHGGTDTGAVNVTVANEVTTLYSNSATVAGGASATSVTVTYTAANTGANRLMLVGVVWNCGTDTDNETINTATYTPSGGSATAMTLLYDYDMFPGSGTVTHRHNAVYYVVNPTSGAGQVDVTFNSSGGDGVDSGIVAGVSFFGGVNQSTPLGTYATASGGASGSASLATVDVTGLNGNELVFDSLFRGGTAAQTPGANQTALWNASVTNAIGAASREQATSGTVTTSWTSTNGQWIIIAVPINPAGTGTTYTLTYTAGAHGSISGTSPQTVADGGSGTAVTAVPATGYHFVNWSDASTANPRTDTNVLANISVTANFAINTYTLTYTAGANGSITGTSPQTVNYGASGTAVTAVPATGYHFVNWSDASTANPRTDTNVQANIT